MLPLDQVLWYINRPLCKPLKEPLKVDVVVVGGGIAGLSAAQRFHECGFSVALLEKNFCGSGASGKSSGFITPDSEFSLHNLLKFYGEDTGKKLWEFACNGVNFIEQNIKKYNLTCDYQRQDTLVVATSDRAFKKSIEPEHRARTALNYKSTLYPKEHLSSVLNSEGYYGGVQYGDTFGIGAYRYCQEMKNVLQNAGVFIYEETPVIALTNNGVKTVYSTVSTDRVVVCIDRFITHLGKLLNEIYHVQTFLMMSAPLTETQVKSLFPTQNLMVWDTDLIYNYFRLTGDNRLMLGGARLLSTYAREEQHHNKKIIKKLITYFTKKFPQLSVQFDYIWPGIIGITKDIIPIAGPDLSLPHVYYISGAAGLPWAAALGIYSAENIINNRHDLDDIFSPYRYFTLGSRIQKVLGTRLTFALSNFMRTRSL
jgi:gamma-glutamylputrescine oxidase